MKDTDIMTSEEKKNTMQKKERPGVVIWLSVLLLLILVLTTLALLGATLKAWPQGEKNIIALFPNDPDDDTVFRVDKVPAEFEPHINIGSAAQSSSPIYESGNTIELFKNKYLNADGDVVIESNNGDKVVAPGAENSYSFSLKNTGNISLDYTLKIDGNFAYGEAKLPIVIRLRFGDEWIVGDADTWVPWQEMNGVTFDTRTVESGKYATYTIEWKWPFEVEGELLEDMNNALISADKNDTILGDAATETSTRFDINVRTVAVVTEGAVARDEWGNILLTDVLRELDVTYIGIYVIIILLVATALEVLFVYFFVFKRKKKEEPEPTPPAPEPEPEPEPELEPEPEPVPAVITKPEPEVYEIGYTATGKLTFINLDTLSENYSDGDTVTMESLKEKGLVKSVTERTKILARGELTVKLTIYADGFSDEAYDKIIASGSTPIYIRRKSHK